jgi:hypothetical protein
MGSVVRAWCVWGWGWAEPRVHGAVDGFEKFFHFFFNFFFVEELNRFFFFSIFRFLIFFLRRIELCFFLV